jgi:hypothetical protein
VMRLQEGRVASVGPVHNSAGEDRDWRLKQHETTGNKPK